MIRVSQRLEYALRLLAGLAQLPAERRVAAGDLAGRLGLPRRFVEQQVTELARAGIVDCQRGAGGGCRLARPADAISVLDVVAALDAAAFDVPHTTGSAVTELWLRVAEDVERNLSCVSVGELSRRQVEVDADLSANYEI